MAAEHLVLCDVKEAVAELRVWDDNCQVPSEWNLSPHKWTHCRKMMEILEEGQGQGICLGAFRFAYVSGIHGIFKFQPKKRKKENTDIL